MNTKFLTSDLQDSSSFVNQLRIAVTQLREMETPPIAQITGLLFQVIGAIQYLENENLDQQEQIRKMRLQMIRTPAELPKFPDQAELAEIIACYCDDSPDHEWASTTYC